MSIRAKTILKDAIIGTVIGFFILHPISMLIIQHTMPGGMSGMQPGVLNTVMEALMAHHAAMALFFT